MFSIKSLGSILSERLSKLSISINTYNIPSAGHLPNTILPFGFRSVSLMKTTLFQLITFLKKDIMSFNLK